MHKVGQGNHVQLLNKYTLMLPWLFSVRKSREAKVKYPPIASQAAWKSMHILPQQDLCLCVRRRETYCRWRCRCSYFYSQVLWGLICCSPSIHHTRGEATIVNHSLELVVDSLKDHWQPIYQIMVVVLTYNWTNLCVMYLYASTIDLGFYFVLIF